MCLPWIGACVFCARVWAEPFVGCEGGAWVGRYHFKQQKTAKPQSGSSATNISFAHIQAQIETIIKLNSDIEVIDKKSGHQSEGRTN
jgi:hypothetical protein